MNSLKYHLYKISFDTVCGLGGGRYRNNLEEEKFKKLHHTERCKRCWLILKNRNNK